MVAKLEGGYHGTAEEVMGTAIPTWCCSRPTTRRRRPGSSSAGASEIAALLVEPVQGSAG